MVKEINHPKNVVKLQLYFKKHPMPLGTTYVKPCETLNFESLNNDLATTWTNFMAIYDGLQQSCQILYLEIYLPAKFHSNPDQAQLNQVNKIFRST